MAVITNLRNIVNEEIDVNVNAQGVIEANSSISTFNSTTFPSKITELDNYIIAKEGELNTYSTSKISEYNINHTTKLSEVQGVADVISDSATQIQTNKEAIEAMLYGSDTLLDSFAEVEVVLGAATDHIENTDIHFTQSEISITESQISDLGTYLTTETSYPADALVAGDITNINNLSGINTGDQDLSGYSLTTHNHDGIYEPADSTILKDADIGSTVQAYDLNIVSDTSYVHTDNNYTTTEKEKLAGIDESANAYVITSDIDDVTVGINKVYSSNKTQALHDAQSQAIANLATAQAVIVNDDTTAIGTSASIVSFLTETDTTDNNVFTLDDTANTMRFLHNASYNFNTILNIASSTNSSLLVTFRLLDNSDNTILTTQSVSLTIDNGNIASIPLATLLTVGKNLVPTAPLVIRVEVLASGTGFTINSFRSILASSSSYDLTTEASGISVSPSGGIASTNVQAALVELDTELNTISEVI